MDEERRRLIASIPRVSDLDAHKENIQPRPKGRSIGSLATLSSADREAKLEEGHAKFQELLDSLDEQDDPLQIYIDYIDWTIQMYPQVQNLDSNLMSLLKSATDAFKDTLLYKNDLRYLKIWIEYAQWVEEPLDIFLYLRKHGIGQASALYYLEYAAYYEKQDKLEEATQVYEAGLKENAFPVKRLQRSFALFKERVEEKEKRNLLRRRQMEAHAQMESLRATGQRTMLGEKSDGRSRVSVASNVHAGIQSRLGGSTSHSAGVRQSTNRNPPSTSQDNSFAVYVQSSEPSRHHHILPTPSSASSSSALYITPSVSSGRENQRSIDRFAGSTLPQASTEKPTAPQFQVYQDPTQETLSSPSLSSLSSPPPYKRSRSCLSFSTSESSLSKLRRQPTSDQVVEPKRMRLSPHEQKLAERFKKLRHRLLLTTSTKGTEYIHVLKELDEDMSFEEKRARHYGLLDEFKRPKNGFFKFDEINEKAAEVEYTEETLKALESINKIFTVEDTAYTKEEEDLTWNNRYQTFRSLSNQGSSSHHIDENKTG